MSEEYRVFQGGIKRVAVTKVTLVSQVALTIDVTVPAFRRWELLTVKTVNADSVNRTIIIERFLEAAKTNRIEALAGVTVGTGVIVMYPNTVPDALPVQNGFWHKIIMAPTETISVTWNAGAASAGGADADGLVIEYLETRN